MKDLSRFCISTQCENICRELRNFQENKKIDVAIIDSSFEIISFCFNMCGNNSSKQLLHQSVDDQLLPFIVELFRGKKKAEITSTINSVLTALNQVRNNEKGDVSPATKFFGDIADTCFSQSIYADHKLVSL